MGHAGSIIRDPAFGSRILRVTDAKSDPQGQGRSFMTASSAQQNTWNTDSSEFYVLTRSGQYMLYGFDPLNLKIHYKGVLQADWAGEPESSYIRQHVLYGTGGKHSSIEEYDTNTAQQHESVIRGMHLEPRGGRLHDEGWPKM